MISAKKKASNAKWDKQNMMSLSCRIKKDCGEKFKALCAEAGTTSNAVLKQAAEKFMKEHSADFAPPKKCEYCGIMPAYKKDILGKAYYDKYDSQKVLSCGGMHCDLVIGADQDGKIFMEADEGDDLLWYPNFCPVCGRDLKNK